MQSNALPLLTQLIEIVVREDASDHLYNVIQFIDMEAVELVGEVGFADHSNCDRFSMQKGIAVVCERIAFNGMANGMPEVEDLSKSFLKRI